MIWIIFGLFFIVSLYASNKLKSKFRKYSATPLSSGLSGAEIAANMLRDNGIYDVRITCVEGQLTDHYNPAHKTVNLSEAVYYGRNAAAAAVAAHECGHAVQHAHAYQPLRLRTALVPVQNVSARIINLVFMAMFFGSFALPQLIHPQLAFMIIIACYGIFTLFAFITLPVEFDASRRAIQWIQGRRIVNSQEAYAAKDALNWAASTYVIAALSSLVTLVFYILQFMGGRD